MPSVTYELYTSTTLFKILIWYTCNKTLSVTSKYDIAKVGIKHQSNYIVMRFLFGLVYMSCNFR